MVRASQKWALLVLLVACEHPDARAVAPSPAPTLDAASFASIPIADASTHDEDASAPDTSVAVSPASPPDAPDASSQAKVRAWFSVTPHKKCPDNFPDYGQCYGVTLSLRGAVERELVVKKNQWGQQYCRTNGKTVDCGGASGSDSIAVRCAPSGTCVVESVAESDGYCPPPEDCATRTTLVTFTIPSGSTLVYSKD